MDIYRIYLRHPGQRVSDKTTTSDRVVAEMAFRSIVANHAGEHAAVVISLNNVQQRYVRLDRAHDTCNLCQYVGPFIDDTCPRCSQA